MGAAESGALDLDFHAELSLWQTPPVNAVVFGCLGKSTNDAKSKTNVVVECFYGGKMEQEGGSTP